MKLRFFNHLSIKIYSFFKVRDSLVLFLIGTSLLATGLHGVSVSEEPTYADGKPKPTPPNYADGNPRLIPPNIGQGAPAAQGQGVAEQSPFFPYAPQSIIPGFGIAEQNIIPGIGIAEQFNVPGVGLAEQPVIPGEGVAENNDVPYDDTLIRFSVGNLYKFIEGAFGALIVVGAGIGAIIAAAVGAYKAALSLFVTAVGAFILRSYVSLFFGTNYDDFTVGLDDVNPN